MKGNAIRKVTIAPDKFKGTLTASEAASAMAEGVLKVLPDCEIRTVTMADGGEGTSEIVGRLSGFAGAEVDAADALMRPVKACCMMSHDGSEVLIDSSAAVGLAVIPQSERRPFQSSSYGLGMAVRTLLGKPGVKVTVGIGGTATVDAGIGFLQALGAEIYIRGKAVARPVTAADVIDIERIDLSAITGLSHRISGISDVDVPLLASDGGPDMLMFAPQKGVAESELPQLRFMLAHLRDEVEWLPCKPDFDCSYGGAGGGLGFAIGGVLRAGIEAGAVAVIERSHLFEPKPDLIITGEGRFDLQSLQGKVTGTIFHEAELRGISCLIVAGSADASLSFPWLFAAGSSVPSTTDEASRLLAEATRRAVISICR